VAHKNAPAGDVCCTKSLRKRRAAISTGALAHVVYSCWGSRAAELLEWVNVPSQGKGMQRQIALE
jgi:hypothetical protein